MTILLRKIMNLTNELYILAGLFVSIELAKFLPIVNSGISVFKTSNKAIQVISSKYTPDERKQKVLLIYSYTLFINSLKVLFYTAIILFPVFVAAIIATSSLSEAIIYLSRLDILIIMIVVALVYIYARNKFIKWKDTQT